MNFMRAIFKPSDLTLRKLSSVFSKLFLPIIIRPPVTKVNGRWETLVRADIIRFVDAWASEIHGDVLDVGGGCWDYPRTILSNRCNYLLMDCVKSPQVDVVADIHRLTDTFETARFDFLLCFDVLEHVADPIRAARQMHAILKPRGKLLLTIPFNYYLHSTVTVPDLWRITDQGLRHVLSDFAEVLIESKGPAQFPRSYLVVATK
ncbi:MAG: class I SAM-dependent methyltransferase [Candidatus Abyssobacteria bacterium SURF_5]|uniref:Class I SAM-dependent methyltransferase n=1 Tax=Abyssobacteria bacterium (strain SURF_5) TaxID=2093360 RepID=A0A3A4NPZ5_ABYX5|nr:MAG: class I SAM-dependent methyltransferase [Candidatus Abyssubacteria bacterium SURF_5]